MTTALLTLSLWLHTAPPPPVPCDTFWPAAWKAYAAREKAQKRAVPVEKKVKAAWFEQCRTFSFEAQACARGDLLEQEIFALRQKLKASQTLAVEVSRLEKERRDAWTMLECPDVEKAFAAAVSKR